jgi:hypothetical protein
MGLENEAEQSKGRPFRQAPQSTIAVSVAKVIMEKLSFR